MKGSSLALGLFSFAAQAWSPAPTTECLTQGCAGGSGNIDEFAASMQQDASSMLQARRVHNSGQRTIAEATAVHPQDYKHAMTQAVHRYWQRRKGSKPGVAKHKTTIEHGPYKGVKVAAGCLLPDPENPQKIWWGDECSINNWAGTFYYVNALVDPPRFDSAERGEIIAVACDNVYCPSPPVEDCYYSPGICKKDEWCWHKEHEKFGYWGMTSRQGYGQAMSEQNHTYGWSQPPYCSSWQKHLNATRTNSNGENNNISAQSVTQSATLWCPETGEAPTGVWRPVQAQCVKYRTEWQSCLGDAVSYPEKGLTPAYKLMQSTGVPFERPLLCHPGLVCTGANYEVMPSTCVPERVKDTCYYGPWWDSTKCPRTTAQKIYKLDGGLNWQLTMDALKTAILTYPGEVATPGNCVFWANSTWAKGIYAARGDDVEAVRKQLYEIVGLLWPHHVLPPPPSYEELMAELPNPFACDGVTTADICQKMSEEDPDPKPNCVHKALAKAAELQWQPCKTWSVVHFFMHNLVDPVPEKVANAAQALAALLAQRFVCDDCRGFFQDGVIKPYGLPPISTSGSDIARWYWYGHNVASEHVASTRGTHPWLTQLGDQNTIKTPPRWPTGKMQNPWFMPWNTSVHQWSSSWTLDTAEHSKCAEGTRLDLVSDPGFADKPGKCLDLCIAARKCNGFNVKHSRKTGDSTCHFFTGPVSMVPTVKTTCYKIVRQSL